MYNARYNVYVNIPVYLYQYVIIKTRHFIANITYGKKMYLYKYIDLYLYIT